MDEFVAGARARLVTGVDPDQQPIVTLLVKRSYRFDPGRGLVEALEPAPWVAQPIVARLDDRPGFVMQRDFELFPHKAKTDVVVYGHVVAPGERPVQKTTVSVRIDRHRWVRDVLVFGDRRVEGGRFSEPEPFTRLPLCWTRAYGGIDTGVEPPRPDERLTLGRVLDLHADLHPGACRSNPVGTGWVARWDSPVLEGLALPNFEAPDRLLTPETLVRRGDPTSLALEPQGFGWVHSTWHPRRAFLGGLDRAEPSSIAPGWATSEGADDAPVLPRYSNGAPPSAQVEGIHGGERLAFAGFTPEPTVELRLPIAPTMKLSLRRRPLELDVALHTLELEPDQRRLTLLWAARARTGVPLPLRLPEPDAREFDPCEGVEALLDGQRVPHDPQPIQ